MASAVAAPKDVHVFTKAHAIAPTGLSHAGVTEPQADNDHAFRMLCIAFHPHSKVTQNAAKVTKT